MDEYIDCPYCKSESLVEEFNRGMGRCPVCGRANYELDGYMNGYRQGARTAATCQVCGDYVEHDPFDNAPVHLDEEGELDHENDRGHDPVPVYDEHDEWRCGDCGKTTTGAECHYCGGNESVDDKIVRAMENYKERRDRMGAIDFIASQNTTDREELLFRGWTLAAFLGSDPTPSRRTWAVVAQATASS